MSLGSGDPEGRKLRFTQLEYPSDYSLQGTYDGMCRQFQRYDGAINTKVIVRHRPLSRRSMAPSYKCSAAAGMGDRVRAKWAEKWGLLCPFPYRGLGPHLTHRRLGRGLPP